MRVAVLGVGLIGGSVGLAARARAGAHVCGFDPDGVALQTALALGAIDEGAPDIQTAVTGAQVVFAAAPVGALSQCVLAALAHAGADCVLSDVGSTKLVLHDARSDPRFVGGHPLAGAENAGVGYAREDLFDGATWYLTPGSSTDPALYERLRALIERFGARPATIAADAHDRLMAGVSHLPHVLANVLAVQAAEIFAREEAEVQREEPEEQDEHAVVEREEAWVEREEAWVEREEAWVERRDARFRRGPVPPSLADAIRVAGSNTAIWTDIYLANREALVESIEDATRRLAEVRGTLQRADAGALAAWNEQARAARDALLGEDPPAPSGQPAPRRQPPTPNA